MVPEDALEEYIETLGERLDAFAQSQTTVADQQVTVFHDRSLSLWKFGFVDSVFVVGTVDTTTDAERFSAAAFEHGLALKSILPRGLGGNLLVYPIIVSKAELTE